MLIDFSEIGWDIYTWGFWRNIEMCLLVCALLRDSTTYHFGCWDHPPSTRVTWLELLFCFNKWSVGSGLSSQILPIASELVQSGACRNEANVKRQVLIHKERFDSDAASPGRRMDLPVIDHHPFLLNPRVLIGIGSGELLFSSTIMIV